MRGGWILLWRRFAGHPFWLERRRFSKAEAWLDLLLDAAFEDHEVTLGNTMITLRRGRVILSQRGKAKRWGWARNSVARYLTLLEKLGQAVVHAVGHGPEGGYTILSISNYEKFQNVAGGSNADAVSHDQGHVVSHVRATRGPRSRPRSRPIERKEQQKIRDKEDRESLADPSNRIDFNKNGFDTFWTAYPKKVARPAALKAWERLQPENGLLDQILQAVELQKRCEQWQRDGGRFIPNPATWLNGRRWEDELRAPEWTGLQL